MSLLQENKSRRKLRVEHAACSKKVFFCVAVYLFAVQAATAFALASQVQKCRGRFVAQCWPEPATLQSTYVKTISCLEI